MVDHRNRFDGVKPQRARHRNAARGIGIDADDKLVGNLGGKSQQSQMAGMHDIEIARNKRHPLAGLSDARSPRAMPARSDPPRPSHQSRREKTQPARPTPSPSAGSKILSRPKVPPTKQKHAINVAYL